MPYVNVTHSEKGGNQGSCRDLVEYLEKENQAKGQKPAEKELWFDQKRDNIGPDEVTRRIDRNTGKLKKTEAKFFLVNVSPSAKELAHLGNDPAKLKEYAREVMESYAQNFKKGIGAENLLYFGKVEYNRTYKHTDPEVKAGQARRGEPKEGAQMHVQIIVSRKDAENKRLLSPLNNSSGKNAEHSAKFGQFNQMDFKQGCEAAFDRKFGYEREFAERLEYVNTMKNGNVREKAQLLLSEKDWKREKEWAQKQQPTVSREPTQEKGLSQGKGQQIEKSRNIERERGHGMGMGI